MYFDEQDTYYTFGDALKKGFLDTIDSVCGIWYNKKG